ncbi:hypothetical protein J2X46_003172 [Nocardioides sp. BE266]|uniref:type IV secretion system protein n=1 Tax=Nocardioides sp. BE266 TaxID=2817725 RepID=UPI002854EAF1|nr:type IV secretion system protein [Nocardioides sp. BE266]MDR7254179.1 hypothetical protein [Nocardioides sp. BE266]
MPRTAPPDLRVGLVEHGVWSRRRLIAILAAAALAATLLVTAFGYGVYRAVTPTPDSADIHSTSPADGWRLDQGSLDVTGPERRDAIAGAPMLDAPPSAVRPPTDASGPGGLSGIGENTGPGETVPSTTSTPPIEIPAGDAPGPAFVASGFPRTPQGAIGQLAQIDVAVLQAMDLRTAREVHAAWALPGGTTSEEWWITASVRAFLDAASMGTAKDPAAWVQVEPAAALVKGTDGPDWTTVCVLLHVSATYRSTGEVALGHCERMQWVDKPVGGGEGGWAGGRWMIAPGTPPALAPSTWPGSPLATEAGWERWETVRSPSATPPALSSNTPQRRPGGPTSPAAWDADPAVTIELPDISQRGIDWPDLNPLDDLGSVIAKAAADAWTSAMMAVWASGLFVLRVVLTFAEAFLTPDLSTDGPGRDVYAFTLWMAGGLATILALVQLGRAAFTREGKRLARAAIGAGQFVLAYACWLGYCSILVAACGTLSRALMGSLLGIETWPEFDPLGGFDAEDITDSGTATVLAFLGVFLWLAAIGHILVYLARAASLLVLAATGPVAAAGLVADSTRSWFWKSLRWFHAAALTPVLMVLVLGIGVQFANGVAASMAEGAQQAVATALPAVMLILVSTIAPMALFKLLAFVDPGTPSGASFRQGMAAAGGVQGLLTGNASSGAGGASGASAVDGTGRSSGEQGAEDATGERFAKATQGAAGLLGPVGQAAAAGIGVVTKAGALAASLMSDQTNQAGAGQGTYGPDFSSLGARSGRNAHQSTPGPAAHMSHDSGDGSDGDGYGDWADGGGSGPSGSGAALPVPPTPSLPGGVPGAGARPVPAPPSAGPGSAAGGAAAGSGAAGSAAVVPIPPVA